MRVLAVLSSFLLCIAISGAWPWPPNFFSRSLDGRLVARDDPPKSSAAPASSAAQNTASNTGSATGSSAPSGTGSQSGSAPTSKPTGKDGGKDKGNSTSSVSINPENPAGGISMVNPAPTATTWYKYGNNITWVWNYTSLVITPSAIDVLVSCQDTASTFTVAQNVSVNATQSIIWDTSKETGAGITDKYTMVVFDAGNPAGVSATAAPGKLGVVDFLFSIYTPQPYQGIGDGYSCVTCNGAISAAERQALGIMLTMATITVLSFGYFANGFLSL